MSELRKAIAGLVSQYNDRTVGADGIARIDHEQAEHLADCILAIPRIKKALESEAILEEYQAMMAARGK